MSDIDAPSIPRVPRGLDPVTESAQLRLLVAATAEQLIEFAQQLRDEAERVGAPGHDRHAGT